MQEPLEHLAGNLAGLFKDPSDRLLVSKTIQALNEHYSLAWKMKKEPSVAEIIAQMTGRLAHAYPHLTSLQNQRILDIACGSNTSRLPASVYINTPFGEMALGRPSRGYTAMFEPWFCRILKELGALPVGVDFGNLDQETFQHYRIDLGKKGALDFLPDHSFDGIQDSRLFGSPEFTAQFPHPADRMKVAQEIRRQENRLLKVGGIIIHSDAAAL